MFVPLKINTEYTLLQSTIKVSELVEFLKINNIASCAICDDNLYGVMDFYSKMIANNLKPIIGLSINIDNYDIYLYAKNYEGYLNLLKIHTLKEFKQLTFEKLENYLNNIKIVLPFNSYELLDKYPNSYLGYKNDTEKINALLKSERVVYCRDVRVLKKENTIYLSYLEAINKGILLKDVVNDYSNNYMNLNVKDEDKKTTIEFTKDIDINLDNNNKIYIPKYDESIDSFTYLYNLAYKGLSKRLKGNVTDKYKERLEYVLSVIKKMGFVDYFLIVYDYV